MHPRGCYNRAIGGIAQVAERSRFPGDLDKADRTHRNSIRAAQGSLQYANLLARKLSVINEPPNDNVSVWQKSRTQPPALFRARHVPQVGIGVHDVADNLDLSCP